MLSLKKWLSFYIFICIVACVLVTLLPWWPTSNLLIIPKYALLFGPRWLLLLLVLPIIIGWRVLSIKQKIIYPLLVLCSFNYLDFQLPKPWHYFTASNLAVNELKVVSYNIGGGGSQEELKLLVKYIKPDILLLQEARRIKLTKLFPDDYVSECLSGLCILSKYPFTRTRTLDRKLFGGWGNFAAFYNIITPNGPLSLANIHLETPRSVLMGVIHRYFDQKLAEKIEDNRQFEVDLIKVWAENNPQNTVIVGDFNMPADENLFRQSFSNLHNAVEVKGVGFNDTKRTSWYGVRIDHILYTPDMHIADVEVVKLLKGDHQPLMAILKMSELR
jgi:endonuclease/exonuclease/phosphatase family metal-dependent hydrolase